jgi:(p)ppGpp synthase/HD superfamily hydrolase
VTEQGQLTRLDKGILFAIRSHAGQVDRDGTPHIFHSLRVMERVRAAGGDEDLQIAAVLHDVIEDTRPHVADKEGATSLPTGDGLASVQRQDLVLRFGERVADAVVGVSRNEGEVYAAFVARAASEPDSRFIKFHDVHDNLERSLAQGDSIATRYVKALGIIAATEHHGGQND